MQNIQMTDSEENAGKLKIFAPILSPLKVNGDNDVRIHYNITNIYKNHENGK